MTTCYMLRKRRVLDVSGPDRATLLQGLITNDVHRATPGHAVFAALLTPQGKILFDFILANEGESLLIDCEAERSDDLMRRLMMYKLRAKAELAFREDWAVAVLMDGGATLPQGAISFVDPRSADLGSRVMGPAQALEAWAAAEGMDLRGDDDYAERRIALGIPEGQADFGSESTLALEGNLDLLNGVDFQKGCYVGQELTARTHYRGKVRYRLFPVTLDGEAAPGSDVTAGDKRVGTLVSRVNGAGIARLRQEDLEDAALTAGAARLTARALPGGAV